MKKLALLLVAGFLFSCHKDKNEPNSNDVVGSIKYKIDGQRITFSNGFVKKITGTPGAISTTYLIQGSDGSNSANIFIFTHSDTLKQQTYHLVYGAAPIFTIGEKEYSLMDTPDHFLDVSIYSYKNGYISGSFEGVITHIVSVNPTVFENAVLSEGVFKNLKVTYY